MYDERSHKEQPDAAFTWWSWRPGIRPGRALLIGASLMLVGLFFIAAGIYSLVAILIDSHSSPTRVPGVVTGYTRGLLDNQIHLTIHAQHSGASSTVSPAITPAQQLAIHIGDHVVLDYSPRLGYLYALEDHGQRYILPGGSPLGNLFASIGLALVGLLFLPYPFLLFVWGLHDLREPGVILRGRILALRATQRTRLPRQRRPAHPGLTPRLGRAWYGMAIKTLTTASQGDIITFAISAEQHGALREGETVAITYSPHLRYVRAIQPIDIEPPLTESKQQEAR